MHQCAGTIRCARETTGEDRRRPVLQIFELKEAALWHEDTKYISQANDASVEDIITLVRRSRSRSKPREVQNWSQPSESATKQLSLPACACTTSLSHTAEVELCAESDSANAGDPIMCGCNSSTRLEGAIEASFSDSRRKGDVPMATCLVVDVPRGHSFYRPTLFDDTGRDKGGGSCGKHKRETRERLRIVARERKQNVGENYSKKI